MSYVIFENKGVLDARAIRTFGVSAKEKENAIGYFGTGMKYAIAILIREGLSVELMAGGKKFVFEKKDSDFRGTSFEAITMNGEELPFTTKLGRNWEVWQAFRELYCNALDENGRVYMSDDQPIQDGTANSTHFIVSGKAITEAFHNRHKIVLSLPESMRVKVDGIEIYSQASQSLYYRGVRVFDFEKPSLFTYNILDEVELTEDRTLKFASSVVNKVPLALSRLNCKSTIRKVLTAEEQWAERDFSFLSLTYYHEGCSEEFLDVLAKEYRLNNDRLNKTAREVQRKIMNRAASKHYEPDELTPVEEKQLSRAREICLRVYPDFSDFKILVVKSLGQETVALADESERCMVLSKKSFSFGTKFLVSTMIEEYMHLKTGHTDCSRALQTHLFDSICSLIEDHVLREPM
jgi:hypothetical protein